MSGRNDAIAWAARNSRRGRKALLDEAGELDEAAPPVDGADKGALLARLADAAAFGDADGIADNPDEDAAETGDAVTGVIAVADGPALRLERPLGAQADSTGPPPAGPTGAGARGIAGGGRLCPPLGAADFAGALPFALLEELAELENAPPRLAPPPPPPPVAGRFGAPPPPDLLSLFITSSCQR